MRLDEHLPLSPAPRTLPAPTPILPQPVPTSVIHPNTVIHPPPVSVAEFYVENFHPQQYPTYTQHPPLPYGVVPQEPSYHHTYQQQLNHPSFTPYSPFDVEAKRHAVRNPHSGKFVRGGHLMPKRQDIIPNKERKRPGPKAKIKTEEVKPPEEPEYDPEVIANAHLTMEDDYYVCSVCKMKFKQPGNARRHIITVHRNEKPHNCCKCGAKFGRKVRHTILCGAGAVKLPISMMHYGKTFLHPTLYTLDFHISMLLFHSDCTHKKCIKYTRKSIHKKK